jgi:hypothetical protein
MLFYLPIYVFIYSLFNNATNNFDYTRTVSNGKVNEYWTRKGLQQAIVGEIEVLSKKLPRETEENCGKDSWRPGRGKNRAPPECKPELLQHELFGLSKSRMEGNCFFTHGTHVV